MHNLEFANFKFEGSREARKCLYLWGALHKGWGGWIPYGRVAPFAIHSNLKCNTLSAILSFLFSFFQILIGWESFSYIQYLLVISLSKYFDFFFLANRETHTWSKYTNFNPKSLKLCKSVNWKGKVPLWE